MTEAQAPFYITTAIDYPNGAPHMGHAYEKIISDSYARWYRLLGHSTHFLTGTDENGQKLIEAAKKQGQDTQAFVDSQVENFRKLCQKLNISHDDFIRTTEPRHLAMSQAFWNKMAEKGDVYFGHYSGNYCLACESFYTEVQAPDNQCPTHQTALEVRTEDGYFFRLENYADWILNHIKSQSQFIVPKKSQNEIISRLEQEPLKNLAISRPNTTGWGIPVPGDDKFVMYTWFDALINYYSALTLEQRDTYWPASVHVIGKDIVWFHAVIWPCMLKSMGLEIPKQVYVHGMILAADGRRMSKSLGNGVDPQEIAAKYPLDTFRYYLLRAIPSTSDGRFSEKDLIDKNNNELGNDYGNLIMRVVKLAQKTLPDPHVDPQGVVEDTQASAQLYETLAKMQECMEKREHHRAMDALWEAVNKTNQYVNTSEPWKLKTDLVQFKSVIYNCLFAIHYTSQLLMPFLPETAKQALAVLGVSSVDPKTLRFGTSHYHMSTPEPFFPKIEAPAELA